MDSWVHSDSLGVKKYVWKWNLTFTPTLSEGISESSFNISDSVGVQNALRHDKALDALGWDSLPVLLRSLLYRLYSVITTTHDRIRFSKKICSGFNGWQSKHYIYTRGFVFQTQTLYFLFSIVFIQDYSFLENILTVSRNSQYDILNSNDNRFLLLWKLWKHVQKFSPVLIFIPPLEKQLQIQV